MTTPTDNADSANRPPLRAVSERITEATTGLRERMVERSRRWWVSLALRGGLAILLGVLCFTVPGITFLTLVMLFGIYAIIDGIISLTVMSRRRVDPRRRPAMLRGMASIIAGVVALAWPQMTAYVFLFVLAAWAIVSGIIEVTDAVRRRKSIDDEWLRILTGVAAIAFGVLLLLWPTTGAIALTWLLGAYAIVFGALLLSSAMQVRRAGHALEEADARYAAA